MGGAQGHFIGVIKTICIDNSVKIRLEGDEDDVYLDIESIVHVMRDGYLDSDIASGLLVGDKLLSVTSPSVLYTNSVLF